MSTLFQGYPFPYSHAPPNHGFDDTATPSSDFLHMTSFDLTANSSPASQESIGLLPPSSLSTNSSFFEEAVESSSPPLDVNVCASEQVESQRELYHSSRRGRKVDDGEYIFDQFGAVNHYPTNHSPINHINQSTHELHGRKRSQQSSYQIPSASARAFPELEKKVRRQTKRYHRLDQAAAQEEASPVGDQLPKDPRRRRVLERNRIAATKCRLRKRDEASALAEREQAIDDQHRYLTSSFDSLTAEIYHLKTQLLRHTDCNCVLIQKYIANEAKKSVDNMAGSSEPKGTNDCSASPDCQSFDPTTPLESYPFQWTSSYQQQALVRHSPEHLVDLGIGQLQNTYLMPESMSSASSLPVTPTTAPGGCYYSGVMEPREAVLGGVAWEPRWDLG